MNQKLFLVMLVLFLGLFVVSDPLDTNGQESPGHFHGEKPGSFDDGDKPDSTSGISSIDEPPPVKVSPAVAESHRYASSNEVARLQSLVEAQERKILLLVAKIKLLETELQKQKGGSQ